MKKIFIFFIVLFTLVGCGNKLTEDDKTNLNNMLIKEAKQIFEVDAWINGGIKEGTYTLTLKDLKEKMNKDISKYINPHTEEMCDIEKSKIDFIVKKQKEENKTNYEINVTLVCE